MLSIFSYVYWHLYVLFGEVSIQVICPFFKLEVFLMLSFVGSLYILDINSLYDTVANMVSHLEGPLFILLMISFTVQNPFSVI